MFNMEDQSACNIYDYQERFGATTLQPKELSHRSPISQYSCAEKSIETLPEDLSTHCRLCAFKSDNMYPIFDAADTEKGIDKQISDCLPIVIKKINVVSKLICRSCKETLQKFHDFRNNVLKANEKFESREKALQAESVNENSFFCSYCGKKFQEKTDLTTHIRNHTGEKPFPCDLCGKVFKMKTVLNNHMRTHTGERPFKCSLCEKAFANSARLREHKKFHMDAKPFKCNVCDKAFKRASARKIHMTIHTGEKAFTCDICNKAFKRKTDMRKHKKTRHEVSCREIVLRNK